MSSPSSGCEDCQMLGERKHNRKTLCSVTLRVRRKKDGTW
jgi:hypothetical protein